MNDKNLTELRKEIDAIDDAVMKLLSERFLIVKKVGEIKRDTEMLPLDEKRWGEVLNSRLAKAEMLDIPEVFVVKMFTLIHQYALKIEKAVIATSKK